MTIKALAEELGVSKTAITKTIDKLGLRDRLQKEGNKYIVPDYAADQVRLYFSGDLDSEPRANHEKEGKPAGDPDRDMIIELLRAEIEQKNQQIAELHLILQQQNHLLLAAQAPAEDKPIDAGITPEADDPEGQQLKKGVWRRLFGI